MKVNPVIVFKDDEDFVNKIKGFKGYSQAVIGMSTLQKTTKKNREKKEQKFEDLFKGKIIKTSESYVSIGYEYEKSVNNRLEKEGKDKDFETQGLPWGGAWLKGSKIIIIKKDKNGNTIKDKDGNIVYYLRYSLLNANSKFSKKWYHYSDGTSIDSEEDIKILEKGFLPVRNKSKTQGTDNDIKVCAPKVSNIITLKFAGKTYVRKGFLTDKQKKQLTAWLLKVPVNELEVLKVA